MLIPMLSAAQIKAARALLDWSQKDAAKASSVSLTVIRSLEVGFVPRRTTMDALRAAFENAGLEFLEGDGVRRRNDLIKLHQGPNSCDDFFDEILATTGRQGDEIIAFINSIDVLMQTSAKTGRSNLQRLESLQETAAVKCLLAESIPPSLFTPPLAARPAPIANITVTSSLVYGDKFAEIILRGPRELVVVVYAIPALAHAYREKFLAHWNALALFAPHGAPPQRIRAAV